VHPLRRGRGNRQEIPEPSHYCRGHRGGAAAEVVAGAVDREEPGGGRDQGERLPQLLQRAEGVAGAVDEERRRAELREVGGPSLGRAPGRMERVGEQEQRVRQPGLLGREDAGLAPAVGVAAQEDAAGGSAARQDHRRLETFPVAGRGARPRRAGGRHLAKGEVAAKRGDPVSREGLGYGDQERRVTARAGAVGEDERVPRRRRRHVPVAADTALRDSDGGARHRRRS